MATDPSSKISQARKARGSRKPPSCPPPQDFNLNPTQLHSVWILNPRSHLGCFLPPFKDSSKTATSNSKPGNPWENLPTKNCNRAGFMLLFQVLTPWNRVEGGGRREIRVSGTNTNYKRPIEGGMRTEWETTKRPPQPHRQEALERLRQDGVGGGGN